MKQQLLTRKFVFIAFVGLSIIVQGCREPEAPLLSDGHLLFERACYLHNQEGAMDSAMMICQKILDNELYGEDKYLHLNTLQLQSKIYYTIGDAANMLDASTKGYVIAVELNDAEKESDFLCRAGYALWTIGQKEEGIRRIRAGLDKLHNIKSYDAISSYVNGSKRLIVISIQNGEYERALEIIDHLLDEIDVFASNPSHYWAEYTSKEASKSSMFIDFYRGQLRCFRSQTLMHLGRLAEAEADALAAENSEWINRNDSQYMMLEIWLGLKQYKKFYAALDAARECIASDTLTKDNIDLMNMQARAASELKNEKDAAYYYKRAQELTMEMHQKAAVEQIAMQAATFRRQEDIIQKKEEEKAMMRQMSFLAFIISFLVIVGGFAVYYFRKRRVRRKLYHIAVGDFEEDSPITETEAKSMFSVATGTTPVSNGVQTFPELSGEKDKIVDTDASTDETESKIQRELYSRILQYMVDKEPYCNPAFDRTLLAEEMGSNTSYVSQAINAQGKNFASWVAEFRVKKAIRMMKQNPSIQVKELSYNCGVQNAVVFGRQFKNVTGMTISEFKDQMEKMK